MSAASDTSSPFESWRVDHVAVRVPDFESAIAWYSEKLDFRLRESTPLSGKTYGWMIAPGVGSTFTIELVAGPGAEDRPAYGDLGSSLRLSGWHHLGFSVESVDNTVAELKRRDVAIVLHPRDVAAISLRVAFFADPWGNLFEVTQALNV